MKKEEFNRVKFGDKVFRILPLSYTVASYEIVSVKNRYVLLGENSLEYLNDLTNNEIKELYLDEKEACYAALEEIEALKKPIEERLNELGEQ